MISSVSSSATTLLSGLAAQSRAAVTAAGNITNVTTEGYRAARGQVVSVSPAGASYVPLPPEGGVDLLSEVVNLQNAAQSYALAAKTYAGVTRMERDALNILA